MKGVHFGTGRSVPRFSDPAPGPDEVVLEIRRRACAAAI
jgi:hypothetical protein